MEKSLLGTTIVTQIGIIVRDIEKVAQSYAKFFGIEQPKWSWTDTADVAQTEYKGESSPARAKLAFIDCGQLQIELIEPDQHPSTWREFLDEHGEGVHHIAFFVKGMKEKVSVMQAQQMPLIQKGEYTGGRYAYMDSFAELKVLVELLENDN
ncbi:MULTISPECIES: VOC family protein [unclassified Paenibacillus]|uniref:VOC family protein n=1 Tax=unclassified Paenibacillus TaxID=185978 RepID=UPI0008390A09|nr:MULTISPECIES: VOC family protein [unclassified Paenibacillus]NWL89296.1 lactoylglutathione lyase [Paenibacillus sp. 79R4]